ncbi:hypothetical protein ElyMa_005776100 [Elysia marginata]|uniref:Uncharacterized protein n=1 Tax=Elysia marginata TaxID=1093978 RepID=A0AAV4FQ08_9GAST|nr:hypothetical protein ElyMa_005776100 [Elysia marginata]
MFKSGHLISTRHVQARGQRRTVVKLQAIKTRVDVKSLRSPEDEAKSGLRESPYRCARYSCRPVVQQKQAKTSATQSSALLSSPPR